MAQKFSVQGKAQETKSGFEAYDGETPTKRGFYRALLKILKVKQFDSGSTAFYGVYELEAAKGDPKGHKKFDAAPFFGNVIFDLGTGEPLKDGSQRGLNNFLAAIGVKDNPAIVAEDGDLKRGVKITSIGGKKITALEGKAVVNLELSPSDYRQGELEINGVYPFKDVAFNGDDEDEDDEDIEVDEDEEDEEEIEDDGAEAREEELQGLTLTALRKIAKESDVDSKGLKKDELIEAILDAEFGEAEDEDEESEDEDEPEEDEEDVEEDDEEEDDEEEEEDEEEDDDSEREARAEELGKLNRVKLKAALAESGSEFRVLKRHSDGDIVEAILAAEFGTDTPF